MREVKGGGNKGGGGPDQKQEGGGCIEGGVGWWVANPIASSLPGARLRFRVGSESRKAAVPQIPPSPWLIRWPSH